MLIGNNGALSPGTRYDADNALITAAKGERDAKLYPSRAECTPVNRNAHDMRVPDNRM